MQAVITSMRTLNRGARDCAATVGPHACTDVTGFSLMGHLYQMMRASGMTATVYASQVPFLSGALKLARQGVAPGGTERNQAYFGEHITISDTVENAVVALLFDPQTSGGLLLAVSGDKKDALLTALAEKNVTATVIGEVTEPSPGHVYVV